MTNFDDILLEVGVFGRFQKRIFALISLVSIPWGLIYVGVVFQGFTPEHWCRNPSAQELRRTCGWTLEEEQRYTVPLVNASTGPEYSSCWMYDVDWNSTAVSCEGAPLLNFTKDAPLIGCKDGWVYNYEERKTFVMEFNLVCSDAWKVDLSQSVLNLGFLLGTIVIGYLADRFGRKICFIVSSVVNGITGILVAFSPTNEVLLILRGVCGLTIKGGWMAGYVLITELVGVDHRRIVGIIYQKFFSIGIVILPLIAYFISDWRWIQVAISVPYFIFLIYYWLIPESPRWLFSQKQTGRAVTIVEKLAKENGRRLHPLIEKLTDDEATEVQVPSFLDLFRTPKIRRCTFILMFNWFVCAVVYQGLIMRVGILGGNIYIDFLISGAVEFPSAVIILLTIERVGRRLPFGIATITAGVACLTAAFIPEDYYWAKTAVACIGRLGITISFELVCFVNSELYPTFIRNLGVAVCSTLCDIGGMAAPFILYRLASIWLELPLVVFGVLCVTAGALDFLLPETKGKKLPETIDDIEQPTKIKDIHLNNLHPTSPLPSDASQNKKQPAV
ncbi:solute carrier family 22 member 2-like [Erpetoichthys calabaricus]|uniref:Solute carrier family 22 member 3 n=1 Tax=Erpetoichthys calabaricus TaxID=27687 RepID=A0A8C4SP38_ERPCA|nr:solute carrier family 22 member 2-like [Erpetoichthys calabaricus]XP_028676643.1 solute carrier family 22 member 2-like [Erpetoichthys calabaricus]